MEENISLIAAIFSGQYRGKELLSSQYTSSNALENLLQAGIVLSDFALTRLEDLQHFSNLSDNFRFNAIWHRRSVALILCSRLAEIDVTVTPSVTCMDCLFCLFLARQPPVGQSLLIHEVSRSHTTTHHSR